MEEVWLRSLVIEIMDWKVCLRFNVRFGFLNLILVRRLNFYFAKLIFILYLLYITCQKIVKY